MIVLDVGSWQIRGAWVAVGDASGRRSGAVEVRQERSLEVGSVLDGPLVNLQVLEEAVSSLVASIALAEDVDAPEVLVGIAPGGVRRVQSEVDVAGTIQARDLVRAEVGLRSVAEISEEERLLHVVPVAGKVDGVSRRVAALVGSKGKRLRLSGLVATVSRERVEAIERGVESGGGRLAVLMANPVVTGYALLTEEERERGAVVLDLGSESSTVTLWKGGAPQGVGTLDGGGRSLTDAIAVELGVTAAMAEQLKRQHGQCGGATPGPDFGVRVLGGPEVSRRALGAVVEREMGAVLSSARRMLGASEEGRPVWVLTGGGAMLQGLDAFVARVCGSEARVGHFRASNATLGFGQPSRATLGALVHVATNARLRRTLVPADGTKASRTRGGLLGLVQRAFL